MNMKLNNIDDKRIENKQKTDKALSESKKRVLQDKFIKEVKAQNTVLKKDDSDDKNSNSLLLKNINTKLKKENESLKKKLEKQATKTQEYIDEVGKLKSKLKEKILEDIQTQEQLTDFKKKLKVEKNEVAQLKNILKETIIKLDEKDKVLSSVSNLNATLNARLEKANERNDILQDMVNYNKLHKDDNYNEQINILESSAKSSDHYAQYLKNRLALAEDTIEIIKWKSPKECLSILIDDLDKDNVQDYVTCTKLLFRKVCKLIEDSNGIEAINYNDTFGYAIQDNDNWFFIDIDNNIYSVSGFNGKYLTNGIPCKAHINKSDDTAFITWLLLNSVEAEIEEDLVLEQKSSSSSKINNNTIIKNKSNEDYDDFNSYKVLIIGAINKVKLDARLKKHGLNVDWHNPFEESIQRLKGKYSKADVTVILEDYISHSVTDNIDVLQEDVEKIQGRHVENVIARIRYNLTKRSLIKNYNEDGLNETGT